ncbi:MAG TPA: rhomboid family intramembrane serine protease [Terracidiphilus sp.]|nr:rhomboid family intramembrane serine protease [Terracidiphilus sp.]
MPFGFPGFTGATRRLVFVNLAAYFFLLILGFASAATALQVAAGCSLIPQLFLHGALWQPLTYSFVHIGLVQTLLELLSLWFLAGFLEGYRSSSWVTGLYAASVLGTAVSGAVIWELADMFGRSSPVQIYGCMGGIFGLLIAIGVLYGETEFMMMFLINIKAKYLAIIYALIAFAMLFSQSWIYAFAQLGGALAGLLFLRYAPSKGVSIGASEWVYGLRNRYYRWKRRRAGRKFEVYMRKQGRDIRLDSRGRQIDDVDPNDKSRWN